MSKQKPLSWLRSWTFPLRRLGVGKAHVCIGGPVFFRLEAKPFPLVWWNKIFHNWSWMILPSCKIGNNELLVELNEDDAVHADVFNPKLDIFWFLDLCFVGITWCSIKVFLLHSLKEYIVKSLNLLSTDDITCGICKLRWNSLKLQIFICLRVYDRLLRCRFWSERDENRHLVHALAEAHPVLVVC